MMKKQTSVHSGIPGHNEPEVIDLRGLEAPEPMEKILMACSKLGTQDHFLARLPHLPTPLFPHLEARGMAWQVHEQTDGSVIISIEKRH